MTDENRVHASPVAEMPAPILIDMGPRKVGDLDREQSVLIRARQQSRAQMMGFILAALCVLFFAITVVKIGVWG